MSNIPKRNLASGCHLLKKIDQPSCRRTTRRNYKHIPQIVCILSRFWVLHFLSWEFERSEVRWRFTVILVYNLKHVKVGWGTRNYPHRSFAINMCVVTMVWCCISPWSFHRSLQRRREMDIFHICQHISTFWSKNNQKNKRKKRGKLRLNARKHWESESINRNLSAAVLHVKPSCK